MSATDFIGLWCLASTTALTAVLVALLVAVATIVAGNALRRRREALGAARWQEVADSAGADRCAEREEPDA